MFLYSRVKKEASPLKTSAIKITNEEQSSSRLREENLKSPHSFRNKSNYLKNQDVGVSTAGNSRLTVTKMQPSPYRHQNRSPLRQVIVVQRSSVSPIKKRIIEVPDYVHPSTVQNLNSHFNKFEEQLKERFSRLQMRATRLVETRSSQWSNKQEEETRRFE